MLPHRTPPAPAGGRYPCATPRAKPWQIRRSRQPVSRQSRRRGPAKIRNQPRRQQSGSCEVWCFQSYLSDQAHWPLKALNYIWEISAYGGWAEIALQSSTPILYARVLIDRGQSSRPKPPLAAVHQQPLGKDPRLHQLLPLFFPRILLAGFPDSYSNFVNANMGS